METKLCCLINPIVQCKGCRILWCEACVQDVDDDKHVHNGQDYAYNCIDRKCCEIDILHPIG